MTESGAALLYRWRVPLSVVLVVGALALLPRVVHRHAENDIGAWFQRSDRVYRDSERFRAEFGGTQPLLIALRSSRLPPASPGGRNVRTGTPRIPEEDHRRIERLSPVQRVQSLASATVLRVAAGEGEVGELRLEGLLDERHGRAVHDTRGAAAGRLDGFGPAGLLP